MKICVIGAGVVGCATAYQLARTGHDVIVVDAADVPASAASHANGAQLSYSFVDPLASWDTLKALPSLLMDAMSPLSFRPRWTISQWKWIARFLGNCTSGRARRNALGLLRTARLSQGTLERWIADDGLDFGLMRIGKLVLCPDEQTLKRQRRQVELKRQYGVAQTVLDRRGCIEREPALAFYRNFVGGVWTATDCAADARTYCSVLLKQAQRLGLRAMWSTSVLDLVVKRDRVVCARTNSGDIVADAYVIASGMAAPAMARSLGEALPILAVKGYSMTLSMNPGRPCPATSVTDLARKTVLAPLDGRLRVAAMAELGFDDLDIPQVRLAQMKATVEAIYPGLCDFREPSAWAGLRPATPSSVPIVRQSRVANAFLNAGHGALGFTLAAGCAVQVTEAIHDARLSKSTFASRPAPSLQV